jgi:hypothetical protein
MAFYLSCGAAVPGVCCRMACLPGKRCTIIFASEACRASERGSTGRCIRLSDIGLAVIRSSMQRSLTANRSKRRGGAVAEAMAGGRTTTAASAICWSIRGACTRRVVHSADLADHAGAKLLLGTYRGSGLA